MNDLFDSKSSNWKESLHDVFIDIDEYNTLFNRIDINFGPKLEFKEINLELDISINSFDLDSDDINISIVSIKENSPQRQTEENEIVETRIKKIETNNSNYEAKNGICLSSRSRSKRRHDSYHSTNVNNTRRSSNMSKSIKMNDSLTKFRKKKYPYMRRKSKSDCKCQIF
jgi:hypothetical protein